MFTKLMQMYSLTVPMKDFLKENKLLGLGGILTTFI